MALIQDFGGAGAGTLAVPARRACISRREPAAPIGGWFGMADPAKIERVRDVIEKVGIGMLTTRFPAGLRARPLEARPDRTAGVILFPTDARSGASRQRTGVDWALPSAPQLCWAHPPPVCVGRYREA